MTGTTGSRRTTSFKTPTPPKHFCAALPKGDAALPICEPDRSPAARRPMRSIETTFDAGSTAQLISFSEAARRFTTSNLGFRSASEYVPRGSTLTLRIPGHIWTRPRLQEISVKRF